MTVMQAMNLALEAFNTGRLQVCRDHLLAARDSHPQSAEPHLWLARLAWRQNDWSSLKEHAEACLAIDPSEAEMALLAASAASRLEQWPEAASAWRRFAECVAETAETWYEIARAEEHLPEPPADAAQPALARLRELASRDHAARLQLLRFYLEFERFAEAREVALSFPPERQGLIESELHSQHQNSRHRQAALCLAALHRLQDKPTGTNDAFAYGLIDSLLRSAVGHEREQRADEALRDYSAVLWLTPDDAIATGGHNRALRSLRIEARSGDDDRKVAAFRSMLRGREFDEKTAIALGRLFTKRREWSEAAKLWRQILAHIPDSAEARLQYARACDRAERFADAFAAWGVVLAADPGCTEAVTGLARLPGRVYRTARAAAAANREPVALHLLCLLPEHEALRPEIVRLRETIARQLRVRMRDAYKQENWREAMEIGRQDTAVLGSNVDAQRVLAMAAMRLENWRAAVDAWERALELEPGATANLVDLARCYLRLKDDGRCRETLKRVLEANPADSRALDLAKKLQFVVPEKLKSAPIESAPESPGDVMPAKPVETMPAAPLLARFRAARAARRFAEVTELASAMIARNGNPPVRRVLARLLTEMERHDEAIGHWRALEELDRDDAEAAFRIAAWEFRNGSTLDAAIRSNKQALRDRIRSSLETPLPVAGRDFRHIAICGLSFCGSTLFDRLLGSLPGVRSIGESHCLSKTRNGRIYTPVDPAGTGALDPICSVCGKACSVLTPEFRRMITLDPASWYQKIAKQLDTETLVSADKNIAKLLDLDPLLRFRALVIFKNPEQAWASERARLAKEKDDAWYLEKLDAYLTVWAAEYGAMLHDLSPRSGSVFLSFDAFVAAPQPVFAALCTELEAAFDAGVLAQARPGHAIAGNGGAVSKLRAAAYTVRIEPLPQSALPGRERQRIAEDHPVQDRYRELLARFSAWAPKEAPRAV